ncbi:DUF6985 domain-containing protein [Undibacterium sp. RuRC25W]|uniref:DUF6985 domain-containing protein n=1 Tax=Undibacterium sp. RuRC25W TaxID=3413047 RepID=UPI003BF30F53
MHIAPLGPLTEETENDWLISAPVAIPALNGHQCEFLIEGYPDDPRQQEFSDAITHFLELDHEILLGVEDEIFAYYKDCVQFAKSEGNELISIEAADQVWKHIQFGDEVLVCRRQSGDQGVYVLLECDCDWNELEGLQIVFKNGQTINKLGPFDDFLSNADVYGVPELERVIYQSRG